VPQMQTIFGSKLQVEGLTRRGNARCPFFFAWAVLKTTHYKFPPAHSSSGQVPYLPDHLTFSSASLPWIFPSHDPLISTFQDGGRGELHSGLGFCSSLGQRRPPRIALLASPAMSTPMAQMVFTFAGHL
jgi:hypothetical protein